MGFSKKYVNVKVGTSNPVTTAGPQSLLAATTYLSAPVPCKGARMVMFKIVGSNNAAWVSFALNYGENPSGAGMASGGANFQTLGNVGLDPTGAGGVVVGAAAHINAGRIPWSYVQLSALSHATTAPLGVQWDIEVIYETEADATMAAFGQAGLLPL